MLISNVLDDVLSVRQYILDVEFMLISPTMSVSISNILQTAQVPIILFRIARFSENLSFSKFLECFGTFQHDQVTANSL